mgnify:CR=1 FL=1
MPAERAAGAEQYNAYVEALRVRELELYFARLAEQLDGAIDLECRLVRDFTNYAIRPHTDSGRKLVSLLFYLPPDASTRHLGTSIYLPKDPGFVSDGSEHLRPEGFLHVARMDYVPNALFAFVRTDFSFHGVEPIPDQDFKRDLMLYDVRVNGTSR